MIKLMLVFVVVAAAGFIIKEIMNYSSLQREMQKNREEGIRSWVLSEKQDRLVKQKRNDVVDVILENVNKTEENVKNDTKTEN